MNRFTSAALSAPLITIKPDEHTGTKIIPRELAGTPWHSQCKLTVRTVQVEHVEFERRRRHITLQIRTPGGVRVTGSGVVAGDPPRHPMWLRARSCGSTGCGRVSGRSSRGRSSTSCQVAVQRTQPAAMAMRRRLRVRGKTARSATRIPSRAHV